MITDGFIAQNKKLSESINLSSRCLPLDLHNNVNRHDYDVGDDQEYPPGFSEHVIIPRNKYHRRTEKHEQSDCAHHERR